MYRDGLQFFSSGPPVTSVSYTDNRDMSVIGDIGKIMSAYSMNVIPVDQSYQVA